MLCGTDCHRGPNGVHADRVLGDRLKRLAQIAFESRYDHDTWMKVFGKNYL